MQLRRSTRTTAATSNGLSSLSPLSLPRRETSAIPHIDNVTSKQESSDAGGGLADRVKLRSRKSSLAAIKLEMPENHSETSTSPILTPPQTPFSEVHTRKHVEIAFEEQLGSPSGSSSSPRKKTRTTASTTASTTDKSLRPVAKAPEGWETTYNLIKQYRDMVIAPVDTMGCERLAEVGEGIDPKVCHIRPLNQLPKFQCLPLLYTIFPDDSFPDPRLLDALIANQRPSDRRSYTSTAYAVAWGANAQEYTWMRRWVTPELHL